MNEVKAKEGYYLTNKYRTVFYKAIKGMNVKEEDYEEITKEQVDTLKKQIQNLDKSEEVNELLL